MSKRHRTRSSTRPPAQQTQPTRGALALADRTVRTFTPAPMAGDAAFVTQGSNQQWGSPVASGQAPSERYFPPMPEVKDDKPLLLNIGASGTAIFSGVVTSEEYNPDFYWKDGVKIYEQMLRNDAQVNAVREIVEQPILRAEKHIVPGSDDARDQEIASFVETCLFEEMCYTSVDGIEEAQTWDSLLRHILMHLWYGFMVFEQVWRVEDGWVKWARWTPLLPRTVWRWWVGNDNALTGVQQWTFREHNYQFVDIPAKKLVRFHRRLEGQNYEGVAALRSAYKHWFYKTQFEKIEAIAAERNAVTPAVIKLPEGFTAADYLAGQTIVANIRANQSMGVTIPSTWDIEYMRNFQHSAAALQPSIQYHDVMIARNMLAQFINLGSTETGAYSLDDSQRKDFLNNLQSICCMIEDTINLGPIKQLVDYNFDGVAVYPKLQFGKVLMSDLAQLSDALSKLTTAGLIHPDAQLEDYIREASGLPSAPQSVIEAYNPTAPTTPSRPDNANAQSHDTQQPTQAAPQSTTSDTAAESGDTGGADGGGGALSEVRLLAEALRDTVRAIDPVERGIMHLSGGGGNPNHIPKGEPGAGQFAPGGNGGHGSGGEHEGSGRGGGGGAGGGAGGGEHAPKAAANGARAARAPRAPRAPKAPREPKEPKAQKAPKAKAEPKAERQVHRLTTQERAQAGLKAEVQPAKGKGAGNQLLQMQPVTHGVTAMRGKFHGMVPHQGTYEYAEMVRLMYGEHQMGAYLHQLDVSTIRSIAADVERHYGGAKIGKGSKAAAVSGIVDVMTQGRYQANFGGLKHVGALRHPDHPEPLREAPKTIRPRAPRTRMNTRVPETHDLRSRAATRTGVHPLHNGQPDLPRVPEPTSHMDEHGQHMPFSHAQFNRAITSAQGIHNNNINETRIAKIGRHEYVVKAVDSTGHQFKTSQHDQQRNEAATVEGMKALGMGDMVPGAAYHVVGSNGRRYSVIRVESGKSISEVGLGNVADKVSLGNVQRGYIGSYLMGMRDRHAGNALFDEHSNTVRHIDFGFGMKGNAKVEARDIMKDLWISKLDHAGHTAELSKMLLPHAMIHEAVSHEHDVLRAMHSFNLSKGERTALHQRFQTLRKLSNGGKDVSLQALQDAVGEGSVYVS